MDGRLKDGAVAALLKGLAARSPGLVVVATRYAVPELKGLTPSALSRPVKQLSAAAGVALLRGLGVTGRIAGQQDHLPRGLLTHAMLRALTDCHTGPDSAQEDLDEAWEIAELGPMRLFMADILLHRARLFHRARSYPWPGSAKEDLAAARKLIEQCGYWKRKEELEDAEAVIGVG